MVKLPPLICFDRCRESKEGLSVTFDIPDAHSVFPLLTILIYANLHILSMPQLAFCCSEAKIV
jgi:hypothetical protein